MNKRLRSRPYLALEVFFTMKKKSFFSRVGDFLLGKGFYMVLLLCIMAIGGSGYYLYHLADMNSTCS